MPALLSFYIVKRLLAANLAVFGILFAIIFLGDYIDFIQDAAGGKASMFEMALISLARTPVRAEQLFPFVVLFATIAAFVSLSRRMELVVARGTGVSVWQIVAPAVLAAAVCGILATAVYNPAAVALKERADARKAEVQLKTKSRSGLRWIRQQSEDGQSVLRAENAADRGSLLSVVTAFVFAADGAFQERVEAETAALREGYWELRNARLIRPAELPQSLAAYRLPTTLTPQQVAETLTETEGISFWQLPTVIRLWDRSGIRTTRFQLQYQELVARPALYASMVLIAATVSLGFTRLGGVWKAVLGGVLAGFVLYIGGEMAGDLGATGFIAPAVAAWAPPIIGVLASVTVLLYREDG